MGTEEGANTVITTAAPTAYYYCKQGGVCDMKQQGFYVGVLACSSCKIIYIPNANWFALMGVIPSPALHGTAPSIALM